MLFGTDAFGAGRIHPQHAGLEVRLELNSDRGQISHYFPGSFVVAHEQRALAAPAGCLRKLARQGGFGSAGHAGNQRAAAAEYAAAQHRVKTLETRGNPLARSVTIDILGLGGAHPDARRPETHRELGCRVARTAILRDLDAGRGDAVLLTPPESHHAIGHELQEAVMHGAGSAIPELGRDDGGHCVVRQPVANTVDFLHFPDRILEQRQQHVDAVEYDPLCADLPFLRREHDQHAGQVEVAGLDQCRRQMRIQEKELLFRQARQPPIECGAVRDDVAGAFLERDEDAGRALPARGVGEALQGEDGLARARAADEQARAVAGQPATAQHIEPADAGGQLGQRSIGPDFSPDARFLPEKIRDARNTRSRGCGYWRLSGYDRRRNLYVRCRTSGNAGQDGAMAVSGMGQMS